MPLAKPFASLIKCMPSVRYYPSSSRNTLPHRPPSPAVSKTDLEYELTSGNQFIGIAAFFQPFRIPKAASFTYSEQPVRIKIKDSAGTIVAFNGCYTVANSVLALTHWLVLCPGPDLSTLVTGDYRIEYSDTTTVPTPNGPVIGQLFRGTRFICYLAHTIADFFLQLPERTLNPTCFTRNKYGSR